MCICYIYYIYNTTFFLLKFCWGHCHLHDIITLSNVSFKRFLWEKILENISQNLVTGMLSVCGQCIYNKWLFHLLISCISVLNSPLIVFYTKIYMGPLNMFPLPSGILLSFVSKELWRDIAARRVLPSGSHVLSQQDPEGNMASSVPRSPG